MRWFVFVFLCVEKVENAGCWFFRGNAGAQSSRPGEAGVGLFNRLSAIRNAISWQQVLHDLVLSIIVKINRL